jgi:pSer/pThr/pTyr-binding forkhead associated (FHA) protein
MIGRFPGLDIELPRPAVSRKHARIKQEDGTYTIEDMGSTNGFLVNGKKTAYAVLKAGDKITIESFTIVFNPKDMPDRQPAKEIRQPAENGKDITLTQPLSDEEKHLGDLTFIDIGRFLKK